MIVIILINSIVVIACVLIHYEFLYHMSRLIPRLRIANRYKTVCGVFGCLVAHAIEIWIFALAYFLIIQDGSLGQLAGNFDGSLLDSGYFSFTVYTTLGFGDIEPTGLIRYLTGIESLTGLVLITWTASFLFLEILRITSTLIEPRIFFQFNQY